MVSSASHQSTQTAGTFKASGERAAAQIMQAVAEWAPVFMIFAAALSLLTVGIIRFTFISGLMGEAKLIPPNTIVFVSVCIALVSAVARFGLLAMSTKDALAGRYFGAIVGGLVSVGICLYEVREANHYIGSWVVSDPAALLMVIRFVILISFVLEVRMILGYIRD